MNIVRGSAVSVALGAVFLIAAQPGSAVQQTDPGLAEPQRPHPEAEAAIRDLRSPYCPGLMLEVCTSYGGAMLRDSIQAFAHEGWDRDRLVSWVLANHGDTLLANPPAEGSGLLAWIIPPGAFAVGLVLVVVALRVMRRGSGREDEAVAELSADDENRLAEALRELDEEEEPVF